MDFFYFKPFFKTRQWFMDYKYVDKVYVLRSSSEFKQDTKDNYKQNVIDCSVYLKGEIEGSVVFKK